MKAKLIFNLPEESEEFENAIAGSKSRAALQELSEDLRRKIKYGVSEDNCEVYEEIRTNLYNIMERLGVELY